MTATRSLSTSLQHLNRTLLANDLTELADADLVGRFVERCDEAAFTALVRRHGALVLGVCRRVLRHEQDAEDAFQATFLVFARDAASVRAAGAIGNWLCGVAYNVARKARTARLRRAIKEHEAAAIQPTTIAASVPDDLREILDKELNALPGKYRAAIVLCDLMGMTTQQAAIESGCPPKTVGTRLARARLLLAKRLSRRGVTLSAGVLVTALASSATAAIPPALIESTVQVATGFTTGSAAVTPAVAALTIGVSNVMMFKTPKIIAVLVCGVLFVGGLAKHGGFAAHATPTSSAQTGGPANPTEQKAVKRPNPSDHLDHMRRMFDHLKDLVGRVGFGAKDVEIATAATGAEDKKDDKNRPTLAGVWVQKDGELKIEFTDKNAMSISPHGENKVIVILCECTPEKDGLVKAKVTGFEGKDEAKKMVMAKLPIGTEFSFKWKVKADAATLDEVKGDKDKVELLKSRLEAEYTMK